MWLTIAYLVRGVGGAWGCPLLAVAIRGANTLSNSGPRAFIYFAEPVSASHRMDELGNYKSTRVREYGEGRAKVIHPVIDGVCVDIPTHILPMLGYL